jgi:hypothetical protein
VIRRLSLICRTFMNRRASIRSWMGPVVLMAVVNRNHNASLSASLDKLLTLWIY